MTVVCHQLVLLLCFLLLYIPKMDKHDGSVQVKSIKPVLKRSSTAQNKRRILCEHLLNDGSCLILSRSLWLSCVTFCRAFVFLQHNTLRGCEWKCSSRASCNDKKQKVLLCCAGTAELRAPRHLSSPAGPWWSSWRRNHDKGRCSSAPASLFHWVWRGTKASGSAERKI